MTLAKAEDPAPRLASLLAFVFTCSVVSCGESRRSIGEECLRDADCLSDVCAARACASAPTLVTGGGPAKGEEPRIPEDDGAGSAPDGG